MHTLIPTLITITHWKNRGAHGSETVDSAFEP